MGVIIKNENIFILNLKTLFVNAKLKNQKGTF